MNKKLALVTGGSRGIGRAISSKLAKQGFHVLLSYQSNREEAEKTVQDISKDGGGASIAQLDLGSLQSLKTFYEHVREKFSRIDVLVNNAGLALYRPMNEVTEEEFDKVFDVNVKGLYFSCQLASREMKEGGRIINLSSSVTALMLPTYSVYSASKGAVEQITRVLAKELGAKGILINAVAPGPTETELFTFGKTPEQINHLAKLSALGRIGSPEDISNVVGFLAGEESSWVTGQIIRVNGGFA